MSSELLLVDWLKDERRCSHLLGAEDSNEGENHFGGKNGMTKAAIYLEISVFFKARNGVDRSPKSIECKVNSLMSSYKKTKDCINNTGQGVLQEDGELSFRELVKNFHISMTLIPLCISTLASTATQMTANIQTQSTLVKFRI